jgi:hypothetical protein
VEEPVKREPQLGFGSVGIPRIYPWGGCQARSLAAKVDEAIQLWDEMTDTEPARLGVLEDHWRRKRNQEWPWALPFLRNGAHFGESEREIHVVGGPPCP